MNRGGGVGSSSSNVVAAAATDPESNDTPAPEAPPKEHLSNNGDQHRSFGGGGWRGNNGGGNWYQHNNGYGYRRDHDWNNNWGMNGWDSHIQQPVHHRGPLSYPRPSPPPPPPVFHVNSLPPYVTMHPPLPPRHFHGQPYPNPMFYPDGHYPLYYALPDAPMYGPLMPQYTPPLDPRRLAILKQINYYFSDDNLCRDTYLRQNMDDQGWVSIKLIAGFNRVKMLTDSTLHIRESLLHSTLVEVHADEDKIRRRYSWIKWVLQPSNSSTGSSTLASIASQSQGDSLVTQLQGMALAGDSNNSGTSAVNRAGGGWVLPMQTNPIRDSGSLMGRSVATGSA